MIGVVASVLGWLLAVLAACGVVYTAMTGVLVLRFFHSRQVSARRTDPDAAPTTVTILKPLHGAEAGLRQNLAAHFFRTLTILSRSFSVRKIPPTRPSPLPRT